MESAELDALQGIRSKLETDIRTYNKEAQRAPGTPYSKKKEEIANILQDYYDALGRAFPQLSDSDL